MWAIGKGGSWAVCRTSGAVPSALPLGLRSLYFFVPFRGRRPVYSRM